MPTRFHEIADLLSEPSHPQVEPIPVVVVKEAVYEQRPAEEQGEDREHQQDALHHSFFHSPHHRNECTRVDTECVLDVSGKFSSGPS